MAVEHFHLSKSVSITSVLSTVIVGLIVFLGWTATGSRWVALADAQRESNAMVAEQNEKAIKDVQTKIGTIELNTGLMQKDMETVKKDISTNKEDTQKMDEKLDRLLEHWIEWKHSK